MKLLTEWTDSFEHFPYHAVQTPAKSTKKENYYTQHSNILTMTLMEYVPKLCH